jgi:hypothetical protein
VNFLSIAVPCLLCPTLIVHGGLPMSRRESSRAVGISSRGSTRMHVWAPGDSEHRTGGVGVHVCWMTELKTVLNLWR